MGGLPEEEVGDSEASRWGVKDAVGAAQVPCPPLGPKGSFLQWSRVLRAEGSQGALRLA